MIRTRAARWRGRKRRFSGISRGWGCDSALQCAVQIETTLRRWTSCLRQVMLTAILAAPRTGATPLMRRSGRGSPTACRTRCASACRGRTIRYRMLWRTPCATCAGPTCAGRCARTLCWCGATARRSTRSVLFVACAVFKRPRRPRACSTACSSAPRRRRARLLDGTKHHDAQAADDARDGITHVVRAAEHASNALPQTLLLDALGAPRPRYAHCSLVVDSGASRGVLLRRARSPLVRRRDATPARRRPEALEAVLNNCDRRRFTTRRLHAARRVRLPRGARRPGASIN